LLVKQLELCVVEPFLNAKIMSLSIEVFKMCVGDAVLITSL